MTIKRLQGVLAGLVFSLGASVQAMELQGQFIQGGLLQGKVEPGTTVTVGKRQLRTSDAGEFIFMQ